MAQQRSSRPIVAPTIPPSSRNALQLPRISSLPPPRELEELDDGWGEEDAQPAALVPPRAPDISIPMSPAVTANPPVAERQQAELEELQTALVDTRRELEKARTRIRRLESRSATAEADLAAARKAQNELGQQLEGARAEQRKLSLQLEAAQARATGSHADDLRAIKGIGPKLSKKLQEIGISRYSDLAALDADGVAALAELLGIHRNRIDRDGWIEAARQLASGD